MPGKIDPFHAISIGTLAFKLASEGRSIIHMEFGVPSARPPKAAEAAAKAMIDAGVPGYWESVALQEKIAARYHSLYGLDIDPQRIFLTCGASPALVLALSVLFEPGETVAIARPGYVAYRNTMKGLNINPLELECGPGTRYQLTADVLKDVEAQGVLVSSPANPTGSIIAPEELARIAAHCQAKGLRLISDEIYHQLSYDMPTRCMLEYTPNALVVSSFSKYYCMPGWRLGWLVAPEHLCDAVGAYLGNFFLTAPSIAQAAALAAMNSTDELDGHLETYRINRALLLDALPQLGLTKIAPPDGAFYIYADISAFSDDSRTFCFKLLEETGIAAAPGVDFDPVNGHRFVRFSFAVSTEEVEDALERLKAWFGGLDKQR